MSVAYWKKMNYEIFHRCEFIPRSTVDTGDLAAWMDGLKPDGGGARLEIRKYRTQKNRNRSNPDGKIKMATAQIHQENFEEVRQKRRNRE